MTHHFVSVALYRKGISQRNVAQIRAFYPDSPITIITPKKCFADFNAMGDDLLNCIDEDTVIPNMTGSQFAEKFHTLPQTITRREWSWHWQQFLKLYSVFIKALPDKFVIVDTDFLFLQRIEFFKDNTLLFNHNPYELKANNGEKPVWHDKYRDFSKFVLGTEKAYPECVSEFMACDKNIVKKMLEHIEKQTGKPIYDAFCNTFDNSDYVLSEYCIYATYVAHFHPEKFNLKKIRYLRNGMDFYGLTPKKHTLKALEKVWGLQAVAFEKGFYYPYRAYAVLSGVAYLRYVFNFYKPLPFSVKPDFSTDWLYSKDFFGFMFTHYKYLKFFDKEYWQKKNYRKVKIIAVILSAVVGCYFI